MLINSGNLLRDQGDYPAARTYQERAIAVEPQSAELWVNLADTYLKQESVESATEAFRNAISLNPKSIEATISLGAAFQSTGQMLAAKQQYEKVLAIDPRQGAAYCNLGALISKVEMLPERPSNSKRQSRETTHTSRPISISD